MKSFLKENLVLVAGILLPLLLTGIFFASTQIGKAVVDPPQYSVIFVSDYYYSHLKKPYLITVVDERVHYQYSPPDDEHEHFNNYQKPKLFVYDPQKNETKEIALPDVPDPNEKMDVIPEGLENVKVNRNEKSPDGYVFEADYRSSGNLMTELFGGGYGSRYYMTLKKDGYKVKVPEASSYNSHFIAWVIEDEGE